MSLPRLILPDTDKETLEAGVLGVGLWKRLVAQLKLLGGGSRKQVIEHNGYEVTVEAARQGEQDAGRVMVDGRGYIFAWRVLPVGESARKRMFLTTNLSEKSILPTLYPHTTWRRQTVFYDLEYKKQEGEDGVSYWLVLKLLLEKTPIKSLRARIDEPLYTTRESHPLRYHAPIVAGGVFALSIFDGYDQRNTVVFFTGKENAVIDLDETLSYGQGADLFNSEWYTPGAGASSAKFMTRLEYQDASGEATLKVVVANVGCLDSAPTKAEKAFTYRWEKPWVASDLSFVHSGVVGNRAWLMQQVRVKGGDRKWAIYVTPYSYVQPAPVSVNSLSVVFGYVTGGGEIEFNKNDYFNALPEGEYNRFHAASFGVSALGELRRLTVVTEHSDLANEEVWYPGTGYYGNSIQVHHWRRKDKLVIDILGHTITPISWQERIDNITDGPYWTWSDQTVSTATVAIKGAGLSCHPLGDYAYVLGSYAIYAVKPNYGPVEQQEVQTTDFAYFVTRTGALTTLPVELGEVAGRASMYGEKEMLMWGDEVTPTPRPLWHIDTGSGEAKKIGLSSSCDGYRGYFYSDLCVTSAWDGLIALYTSANNDVRMWYLGEERLITWLDAETSKPVVGPNFDILFADSLNLKFYPATPNLGELIVISQRRFVAATGMGESSTPEPVFGHDTKVIKFTLVFIDGRLQATASVREKDTEVDVADAVDPVRLDNLPS